MANGESRTVGGQLRLQLPGRKWAISDSERRSDARAGRNVVAQKWVLPQLARAEER